MQLNTLDIMKLLPHRYPFLLVDRIVEFVKDEQIVGVKNIKSRRRIVRRLRSVGLLISCGQYIWKTSPTSRGL